MSGAHFVCVAVSISVHSDASNSAWCHVCAGTVLAFAFTISLMVTAALGLSGHLLCVGREFVLYL